MRNIIRDVINSNFPNTDSTYPAFEKVLVQGDIIKCEGGTKPFVDATTVQVYGVWENGAGEKMIGPELTSQSPASKRLSLKVAYILTSRLRQYDSGNDKHE